MGIRQQFIAPYTPKENLKGKDQRNWDEKWPEIMLAVNTSISGSIILRHFLPKAGSHDYRAPCTIGKP